MRWLYASVAVLVLAVACSTAPDADLAGRMAAVEGRVADLEADSSDAAPPDPAVSGEATPPGDTATTEPAVDAVPEKQAFAEAATDPAFKDQVGLDDAAISFVSATDTLVVEAPSPAEEDDLDRAWDAAQELGALWGELESFQPVLDLRVGDVRCACSAKLMVAVGAGIADRAVWETACA